MYGEIGRHKEQAGEGMRKLKIQVLKGKCVPIVQCVSVGPGEIGLKAGIPYMYNNVSLCH